jgi:hypothetical protein
MYTRTILSVVGLAVFFVVSLAVAQGRIYKWVDAQGRVHYSDTPTGLAESVDEALPPASSFGTPAETESPTTTATEPALEPPSSPMATAPAPSSEPFPAADVPPPSDAGEPETSESFGDEEPPLAGVDSPEDRGAVGPAADEEEDSTLPPAQASVESFNFTAFDDFIPGGLEGEEALDDESFAAEDLEEDEFE